MTPLRMFAHLTAMLKSPDETMATIIPMVNKYKTAANANKDYDIEWYCLEINHIYTELFTATPAWTQEEIKRQILGRLSGVIPAIS